MPFDFANSSAKNFYVSLLLIWYPELTEVYLKLDELLVAELAAVVDEGEGVVGAAVGAEDGLRDTPSLYLLVM